MVVGEARPSEMSSELRIIGKAEARDSRVPRRSVDIADVGT